MLPARQAFDEVEAVTQDERLLVVEERDAEVGVRRHGITLVDRPVEAGHAVVALDAFGLEHDVVAGLAVVVGVAGATVEHVMPDDGGVEEQLRVLAGDDVEARSALDPVVALVAEESRRRRRRRG